MKLHDFNVICILEREADIEPFIKFGLMNTNGIQFQLYLLIPSELESVSKDLFTDVGYSVSVLTGASEKDFRAMDLKLVPAEWQLFIRSNTLTDLRRLLDLLNLVYRGRPIIVGGDEKLFGSILVPEDILTDGSWIVSRRAWELAISPPGSIEKGIQTCLGSGPRLSNGISLEINAAMSARCELEKHTIAPFGIIAHIGNLNWSDPDLISSVAAALHGKSIPVDILPTSLQLMQSYNFGRWPGSQLGTLQLQSDGVIKGSWHQNESYWGLIDGLLIFFDANMNPTTKFEREFSWNNRSWLVGSFVRERFCHYLTLSGNEY